MKYLWLLPLLIFLSGCLYFTDTGVSTKLYNTCTEHYDADGKYVKECPENLFDYDELDK